MSPVGLFGKSIEEAIVNASKKNFYGKMLEKTSELESKSSEKLTEETLNLSKDALSKGKFSKAVKMDFVDETSKVNEKATNAAGKLNAVAEITGANAKYAAKNPEIVALKYKYMSESVIDFDRATAYLFYADIASEKSLASKVKIPICGDLHLGQVGSSKTAKNEIAFGFNDFDDAITGSFKWDLARIATSVRLAAKEAGLSDKEGNKLVENYVKDYFKDLEKLQEKPEKLSKPLTDNKHFDKHIEKTLETASETSQKDFIKEMVSGGRFKITDKVQPISEEVKKEIKEAIKIYAKNRPEPASFFEIKDSAFLIAGKGSLGRNRYVVLLEGKGKGDQVILELKEAVQPSSAKAIGNLPGNQAERVVKYAQYFSPSADRYLGVTKIKGTDYFVREVSPASQKVDLTKLNTYDELKNHLEAISLITARAHALSGKTREILEEAGSKSELAKIITDFASERVKEVQKEFKEFKEFVKRK